MNDKKPWQQRPGESARAFHAFTHFRDQPPPLQSLDAAYTDCLRRCRQSTNGPRRSAVSKSCSPQWKAWARRFEWAARAAAYDAFVDEQTIGDAIEKLRRMRARHVELAMKALDLVADALEKLKASRISPRDLPKWLRVASDLERLSRNAPTSIVETIDTAPPLDLSALTDDELEVYTRLTEKCQLAAKRISERAVIDDGELNRLVHEHLARRWAETGRSKLVIN